MGELSREQFLSGRALQREAVEIPELGGTMTMQGLTGKQRDEYEASCVIQKGNKRTFNIVDARAKLVCLSAIDPDSGKRKFTTADIPALSQMPAKALDRLFAVAQRLSGITDEDIAELGKLSDDDQGGSSSSDLPVSLAD